VKFGKNLLMIFEKIIAPSSGPNALFAARFVLVVSLAYS
jgi:hypothetical protein